MKKRRKTLIPTISGTTGPFLGAPCREKNDDRIFYISGAVRPFPKTLPHNQNDIQAIFRLTLVLKTI